MPFCTDDVETFKFKKLDEYKAQQSDGFSQIMSYEDQENQSGAETLLTLSNIQYLVEGLDSLLQTTLDGYKRAKVIKLRDELSSYISNMFTDQQYEHHVQSSRGEVTYNSHGMVVSIH